MAELPTDIETAMSGSATSARLASSSPTIMGLAGAADLSCFAAGFFCCFAGFAETLDGTGLLAGAFVFFAAAGDFFAAQALFFSTRCAFFSIFFAGFLTAIISPLYNSTIWLDVKGV